MQNNILNNIKIISGLRLSYFNNNASYFRAEPRVNIDLAKQEADKAKRQEQKNTSAKKGRNKNKPAEKSPESQKTRKKDQNSKDN